MAFSRISLSDDYWETFDIQKDDIEFLYNHLLELETPQSPEELALSLVGDRLKREQAAAEKRLSTGKKVYLPKEVYGVGDEIVFPGLGGESGKVTGVRAANSLEKESFKVMEIEFESGKTREFAAELADHLLNDPVEIQSDDPLLSPSAVFGQYKDTIIDSLVAELHEHEDFVYIAGRWFPSALIVDVNEGNLNLAEALLDMAGGGPLQTAEMLAQVGLPEGVNPKLAEFSLDLALQEDPKFDEVGTAGVVSWYLKRLEPKDVLEVPIYLKYIPGDYDRDALTEEMLHLEQRLEDELSPLDDIKTDLKKPVKMNLIFPHWRSGTLPLTPKLEKLFPTAWETPRVRFVIVDGKTGEKFPGWVVRLEKYVYGLREWYLAQGVMPGSTIVLQKGDQPGEVIVKTEPHISNKEWVRTALIGADGRVVYATLKQTVDTSFDDRMMAYLPSDIQALDASWEKKRNSPPALEQVVVDTLRELAKLNPQAHVHAAELYSAVNVVYRCPPGPILALLATRSWFNHVGDLHFRYQDDSDNLQKG